jgi:DNA-binding transcriptional MerR regulator
MAYSIGELSKLTACPIETIRYYEREGIVSSPSRTLGGHRLYSRANVQQLQFVLKARKMDFSLAEVKELLSLSQDTEQSCQEVLNMADRNLDAIQKKIEQLTRLKEELKVLAMECKNCCAGTSCAAECNIIEAMHSLAYSAV